jgi:hypothetical protein
MRVTLTGAALRVRRATRLANFPTDGAIRAPGVPTGANASARTENLDPHLSLFAAGSKVAQSL